MKEEKIEQLRKIFKKRLDKLVENAGGFYPDSLVGKCANELVYEVKIRINNKGE